MKLEIVNPIQYPGWDELLLCNRNHSFFHTSAWAKVLAESYGYTPVYFIKIHERKLLVLMPMMGVNSIITGRRGVSLPFSDYCHPWLAENVSLEEVTTAVMAYGKKWRWKNVEFRGGSGWSRCCLPAFHYFGHTLRLGENEARTLAVFDGNVRQNIRKAGKMGVHAAIDNSLQAVKSFYLLHCQTRKRHGLPPQPFSFFTKIHEHVIAKNLGNVVLARFEDKIIAGAIFFHFGENALYKFGASDFSHQNLRANNLVMWQAIRWYLGQGFKNFCFGRTETDNTGLRHFKRAWGAEEHVINYFKFDLRKDCCLPQRQKSGGWSVKFMQRLPVAALRLTGSILYKHMA